MRIGVTADTHSFEVPEKMIKDFQNVDLIIHAGDVCSVEDLKIFRKIAKVIAVYGNLDEKKLKDSLPEKHLFELEGIQIGLLHGEGPPKRVFEFVQERFIGDTLDLVIFGHSHQPLQEDVKGVQYFNPGSPTDMTSPFCSYGIIEINNGKFKTEVIKV